MSDNNNNQQQGQSKESKKIAVAHAKAMTALVAVFQGEGNLNPTKKLDEESVGDLMGEVFKEEKEALKERFKEGAKNLIQEKVKYDQFIKQKELEFQKLKDAKTKEFTGKANALLGMVDDINGISKKYYDALGVNPDNAGTEESDDSNSEE